MKMTSANDTYTDFLEYQLLMPEWAYTISAFTLFLIGFFGFFLNLMVILLMCKDRQLWTPLNIILFNLVCADFSVSILGNPFTLVSALFHRWVFGKTMCVLYGFFMALLGITAITSLTVISFERYLMVTRPLSSRHLTNRGAFLSVIFIWSYSLALTVPPLIGWGNYVNEAANISCSVNWHEQSTNTLTYILFLFAMGQIVPFAVISFSYINIIWTMKKNSKRLGRVSRAEARATTMVFIMIVAFTVAWTPYSIFALIEQFGTQGTISPGVGVIPALVAKSSICYDPLIYVGMNTQFRQSIKRVFGIHNREITSLAERRVNTMTSPGPRMTSINEIGNPDYMKKNRKVRIAEDIMISEVSNVEIYRPLPKKVDLTTIQENRPSDERSGDTMCDDDSTSGTKKQDNGHTKSLLDSPVLTIMDDNRTVFKNVIDEDHLYNTYGNPAYEEHFSDVYPEVKPINIPHSYSLDLSEPKRKKRRKMSIEAKYDVVIQSKGYLRDHTVCKFFEQSCTEKDNFKSYLYSTDNSSDGENL